MAAKKAMLAEMTVNESKSMRVKTPMASLEVYWEWLVQC
jgi:hypothetical protein